MKKFRIKAAVLMAAIMGLSILAATVSTAHAAVLVPQVQAATKDTCPAPFGANFTCMFQPATVVSTSHTHIVVHSSVTKDTKTYLKITGHVAIIAVKPKGMSPTGCVDPVALGQIQAGGDFENSGSNTGFWWTHWDPTWRACGEHKVLDHGHWFWEFFKMNCKNRGRIPIGQAPPHVTVIVEEFRSVTSFNSVYDKVVSKTNGTTFVCKNAAFPTLTIINGKGMCFIAIQIPVVTPVPAPQPAPTPAPTPTPGPVAVCTVNGVPQFTQPPNTVINSAGQCIAIAQNNQCPVTGQVRDANGNCVNQANAAELACQQAATAYPGSTVSFNNNTLTCTITQINGNCSTIIVIQNGGTANVTTGGNCNTTTPTPPAAAPTAVLSVEAINDIPVPPGCRPVSIAVNVTNATSAGSVTINPNKGAVNQDCYNSGTRQAVLTLPVQNGSNAFSVNVWAPDDTGTTSDSLTVSVSIPGMSTVVTGSQSYTITHVVHPLAFTTDTVNSSQLENAL